MYNRNEYNLQLKIEIHNIISCLRKTTYHFITLNYVVSMMLTLLLAIKTICS